MAGGRSEARAVARMTAPIAPLAMAACSRPWMSGTEDTGLAGVAHRGVRGCSGHQQRVEGVLQRVEGHREVLLLRPLPPLGAAPGPRPQPAPTVGQTHPIQVMRHHM